MNESIWLPNAIERSATCGQFETRFQADGFDGIHLFANTHLPTSIVYRITPRDHISAAFPEYIVFAFRISGETYAGHPRLSCNRSSFGSSRTTASSSDSKRRWVLKRKEKTEKLVKFGECVDASSEWIGDIASAEYWNRLFPLRNYRIIM